MVDGIGSEGAPRRQAPDLARAVERVGLAVRQERRQAGAPDWPGQVRDAPDGAQPPVGDPVAQPVDGIALGEARERIAAVLAEVDALQRGLSRSHEVSIPLVPGASSDAVAAAQALAEMIAANARPAITAQARIGAAAVKTVVGE